MEPEKEQWINTVLGSLDGRQRPEPSPFLFAKIRNRLTDSPPVGYLPLRVVWLTAASFALLVLLNWRLAVGVATPASSDMGALTNVITDMQLYPTNNQLYDAWSGQNY